MTILFSTCQRLFTLLLLFLVYPCPVHSQTFTGRTEPYNYATISATVPGRISKISHNVGARVRKGQIILHLEKDEEALEVQRRKLLAESKIELNSTKHQVTILEKDYKATKQLFDSLGSVSEDELWKKELEYRRAIAESERLEMLEKKEELEYKIAEAQLRKRNIYAPFSGDVVQVHLREGESCNAQEPLVRLVNVQKCRFIAHVDVSAAQNLKKGESVALSVKGPGAPVPYTGTVEFIAPVVDASSGLLEVRVIFENKNNAIRPGVLGTMTIPQSKAASQ